MIILSVLWLIILGEYGTVALKSWSNGKVQLGKVIEKIQSDDNLEKSVSVDYYLKCETIDRKKKNQG